GLLIVAAEETILEAEAVFHDQAGIRIGAHVLVLDLILLEKIANDARQERDVGAGPDRRVIVGNRSGTRKPGIDNDELGPVVYLRLDHPLKAARMRLGG